MCFWLWFAPLHKLSCLTRFADFQGEAQRRREKPQWGGLVREFLPLVSTRSVCFFSATLPYGEKPLERLVK